MPTFRTIYVKQKHLARGGGWGSHLSIGPLKENSRMVFIVVTEENGDGVESGRYIKVVYIDIFFIGEQK